MNDREFHELRALEREFDDIPEGAASRVLAAVETLVSGGGPDDGGGNDDGGGEPHRDADGGGGSTGGGHGDAGTPNAGGLGASTTGGAVSGASAGAVASGGAALWAARAAYVAIGVAMGAGGHAVIARGPLPASTATSVQVASSAMPSAMPSAMSSTMPSAEAAATFVRAEEPPEVAHPSAVFRPQTSPSSNANSTANSAAPRRSNHAVDERADLDVARAALGRGRPEACLTGLQDHQRKYGIGAFTEERESLWIQALAASGRRAEANARADRFRSTYPKSLFGPAIERALGAER